MSSTPQPQVTICEDGTAFMLSNEASKEQKKITVKFLKPDDSKKWPQVFECEPFQDWVRGFTKSSASTLNTVTIKSIISEETKVASISINADISSSDGQAVCGECTLSAPTIGLLILLRSELDSDHFLFVSQPRASLGAAPALEVPTGTFDEEGNFKGLASEALESLLGEKINKKNMQDLMKLAYNDSGKGVAVCPSVSSEKLHFFCWSRSLTTAQWDEMSKITKEDTKSTKVQIVRMGDAWNLITDSRSMAAIFLLFELRYHRQMTRTPPQPAKLVAPHEIQKAVFTSVSALDPQSRSFNLLVKVVSPVQEDKSTTVKEGAKPAKFGSMVVGDATGVMKFRVSSTQMKDCTFLERSGASVIVRNGAIEMIDGHMNLVVDTWGKIDDGELRGEGALDFSFTPNEEVDVTATEYEMCHIDEPYEGDRREDRRGKGQGRGTR